MRGEAERQATLLLGLTPGGFVPKDHPLRRIKPLVVDVELTEADGRAEREAALEMLERSVCGPATVGADRAYDTRDFVWAARALGVPPHVAQNDRGRRSAIDGRTTRHAGYRQSQRRRKRVEEVFGWIKTVGVGGNLRYLGRARNQLWFELTAAAHNFTRQAHIEAADV